MSFPCVSNSGFEEAPLSEILAAVSKTDGVDISLALSRIGGRQHVLESSLEQMAYIIDPKIQDMSDYLSSGDLQNFYVEAHGFKGALDGIGAERYGGLAFELETAAKAGDIGRCKEIFELFTVIMTSFSAELNSILALNDTREKYSGGDELLVQITGEAAKHMSSFEMDEALACIKKLDRFSYGDETDALMRLIKSKILAFKYDEAVLLLKSVSTR